MHQCVHCKEFYPAGSKELIDGCSKCGGRFFFYIREEQYKKIMEHPVEIPEESKKQIEKDIRQMAGIIEEEEPVILDIESVRVIDEGKFEIDIVNVFNKKRPIVYRIEEGKYIIDLSSTLEKEKIIKKKESDELDEES